MVRDELALLDYRRRVAALYAGLRRRGVDEDGWRWWRAQRDELFAAHPASPVPPARRATFDGLPFGDYDPELHLGAVTLEPAVHAVFEVAHSASGTTPARRFATLPLRLGDQEHRVSVYWLDVYGGGVFVPLRDASNGRDTYGGGRYLLDTAKSADLGGDPAALVVDLNFVYHPSCAHDPTWSCPLAPVDERLPVAVAAGERLAAG
ncbi:DUF1684 domain-containing protein [Egicoccus halophilus]|uniref:DUF1684 domain-containing protein n=1 Tax=Egicoccus halophilus TaxID=1670830 RepID=A0A8J3AAL8_9ACTN|nr:DUF1684 domain-containing protein [Egicoccus halophilus]GGI09239.1 hypothetical protein GCM10011354_33090 [Egicoccus halophilus]